MDAPAGTPPEDAVVGKPGEGDEPGEPTGPEAKQLINSSYIRGDFFDLGRVSGATMAACTDLIYLTARPYANGDVGFDVPDNDATLAGGAKYTASLSTRSGVMTFDGTGTMNCGQGLLQSPDGPLNVFTFGTYIYLDEWTPNAFIFRKQNRSGENVVALQLGTEGQLRFILNGMLATTQCKGLTTGAWHYLALTFDKGTAELRLDNTGGIALTPQTTLPKQVLEHQADFVMGEKLKASLDETFINDLKVANLGQNPIQFKTWNEIKTKAYWKYDDASKPGKDSYSWKTRLTGIRNALAAQGAESKLRLGVAGGRWQQMVADGTARTRFADNLKRIIKENNLDGVDLDFEWCYSAEEFANYSEAILKIREVLGSDACFTVSLHPISYKISTEAIAALDFISLQCYGPAKERFPYEQFVKDAADVLAYGIPKEKLVMGVPFYATSGTGQAGIVAYLDLVNGGYNSREADAATYKGAEYVLNSQKTIRKKVQYVGDNDLAGIMSWDLATDVDIVHDLSLHRVVKEELDYYANPTEKQ